MSSILSFSAPISVSQHRQRIGCTNRCHRHVALASVAKFRMSIAEPMPASPSTGASTTEVDTLIVGAGVSGTSLAHGLSKGGVSLLLTESRDVVGGNVKSRSEGGYIWEEGPNTFQPAAHIMRMAVDLGLKDELVLADSTLPRFVFWKDKLYALPLSLRDVPSFRLLSIFGAIRAGLGAIGFVLPNTSGAEESIKDFIVRHLGEEVFTKMIDPFVSGVYAGDPKKLSMSAALKKIFALEQLGLTSGIVEGAIIRLQQKKKEVAPPDPDLPKWKPGALGSFRNGLLTLPQAVANKLGEDRVRLGWALASLTRRSDGRYEATYDTSEGQKIVIAKTVALTTPASATANILSDIAPGAMALKKIPYPCVWSVTLAYPKSEFRNPLKGFGNLIPRAMGVRTLGTIWSSCLFSGRAPEGMELLLSYIGGAQDEGIKDLSRDEVIATVDSDIKRILLRKGTTVPPVVVGVRKWDRAIPQYNLGYFDIMKEVDADLEKLPGLYLGGNYRSGVAFGDCVLWGTETASEIASFVESTVDSTS